MSIELGSNDHGLPSNDPRDADQRLQSNEVAISPRASVGDLEKLLTGKKF